MKHKHEIFEYITQYFKDKPAQVRWARCGECLEDNLELQKIMQDKEDRTWKAYGNKSPVVWLEKKQSRLLQTFFRADDPVLQEK